MSSYPPPPPIPVQPLQYNHATRTRPSILTVISIFSILLGSLGILSNGGSSLVAILMTVASSATANFPTPPTAVAPISPPIQGAPASEDASPDADRELILSTLTSIHPLSPIRQRHLDALLKLAGKKILPLTGPELTRQSIAANLTDSGHFPSGTHLSNAGADYYVFARGRIDINDNHATFNPSDSSDTLRASATEHASAPPISSASPAPLTPADITQVITILESRTQQKLTAAQSSRLHTELSSPNQTLFNAASPLPAQIVTATIANGVLTFSTATGYATIHSNGNYYTFSGFARSSFGSVPFAHTRTQSITIILTSLLSLALAILLLVAGLVTLRDSPRSRRLHLIYAWLKIPILLLSFASWLWLWYEFTRQITPGISNRSPFFGLSIIFAIPSLIALIYPIFLLIAFNTRSIKDYYPSPS